MNNIQIDLSKFTVLFLKKRSRAFRKKSIFIILRSGIKPEGGSDFLGWVDLPSQFDTGSFQNDRRRCISVCVKILKFS